MKLFSIVVLFFVLMLFWAYTEDKEPKVTLKASPRTQNAGMYGGDVRLTLRIAEWTEEYWCCAIVWVNEKGERSIHERDCLKWEYATDKDKEPYYDYKLRRNVPPGKYKIHVFLVRGDKILKRVSVQFDVR